MAKFISILCAVSVLFLVACSQTQENPMPCTLDAKICPDGSAVGRNGSNNCEFDACPTGTRVCETDERECPGGLMVSRNPNANCEFYACPAVVNEDFSAQYTDGKLTYAVKINKPTPCHMLSMKQQILESYPVQVIISGTMIPPEKGIMCAQVETQEIIQGYVLVNHKPGNIKVIVDDVVLYDTADIK